MLFRQQLYYRDNIELAKMLGMEPDQTAKYEVFVTKKCAGNLRDLKKEFSVNNENETVNSKPQTCQTLDDPTPSPLVLFSSINFWLIILLSNIGK